MSKFGHPFTESIIQRLARRSNADPGAIVTGSGFSFPQRGWMYRSAAARYESGGSVEAMWATLASEISQGQGSTPWKTRQAAIIRRRLTTMISMERDVDAAFVGLLYANRPAAVTWRGHEIAIRLGLEFKDAAGFFMRMLWTERRLAPGQKGRIMVAAAVLAVTEEERLPPYERIEAWHLGTGDIAKYAAGDLRSSLARLDRMLSSAERRAGQPPIG